MKSRFKFSIKLHKSALQIFWGALIGLSIPVRGFWYTSNFRRDIYISSGKSKQLNIRKLSKRWKVYKVGHCQLQGTVHFRSKQFCQLACNKFIASTHNCWCTHAHPGMRISHARMSLSTQSPLKLVKELDMNGGNHEMGSNERRTSRFPPCRCLSFGKEPMSASASEPYKSQLITVINISDRGVTFL